MSDTIVAVLITGVVTVTVNIIAMIATNRKTQTEMDKKIAVMDTKLEVMKEDIKQHNHYAQLFNESIPALKQHMSDVDRRLESIERKA